MDFERVHGLVTSISVAPENYDLVAAPECLAYIVGASSVRIVPLVQYEVSGATTVEQGTVVQGSILKKHD